MESTNLLRLLRADSKTRQDKISRGKRAHLVMLKEFIHQEVVAVPGRPWELGDKRICLPVQEAQV